MSDTKTSAIEIKQFKISNHINDLGIDNVRHEIIQGLLSKQKHISSKFFYNKKGSKLFENITKLPEYYPTRTEKSILKKFAPELMKHVKKMDVVELGSGDCSKIKILLNSIQSEDLADMIYIPVDISQSAIQESSEELLKSFPELSINGLVLDFIHQIDLIPDNNRRLFCFLGSTIGNFTEEAAHEFLNKLSLNMNYGDTLLMGVDLVKPIKILNEAYNDSRNITADFNKNILSVVNKLIKADFNEDDFEHKAFFNEEKSRIEMHLIAQRDLIITTPYVQRKITLKKGENIHTENSYKYSLDKIYKLEKTTGLTIKEIHTDENNWFALVLFQK